MAFNLPQGIQVAQGKIIIDVAQVAQAEQMVARSARNMTSSFGNLQKNLKAISDQMNGFGTVATGVFGTAFVANGLAAAQRIARINALMGVFSSSAEQANERMATLRQIAEDTNQSFLGVAEGALAILPAVGRANVDLAQTVSLVQRLALLDPAQGVAGAAFALRELLSGSTVSLASRFELPKGQLNDLLASAAGNPQEIINGLDELVNNLGLTDEKFAAIGATGAFAFERLAGTVTEAIATAFTPLLNNVALPLANAFSNVVTQLNQTNPALLQTLTIFPLLAAAVVPFKFGLDSALGLMKAFVQQTKDGRLELTGFGRAAGRIAGAGLAVGGGVAVGVGVSQFLARNGIGDQRLLTEDPTKLLLERIGQIITVVVTSIARASGEIAKQIYLTGVNIGFFAERLGIQLDTVRARLADAFLGILEALYSLPLIGNANAAGSIAAFRQVNREQNIDNEGERLAAFDERRDAYLAATIAGVDQFIQETVSNVGLFFANGFGLIETEAQAVEQSSTEAAGAMAEFSAAANEVATEMGEIVSDFIAAQNDVGRQRQLTDSRRAFDEGLQDARAQRDFALQQAQAEEDFLRSRAEAAEQNREQLTDAEAAYLRTQQDNAEQFNQESLQRAQDFGRELVKIERDTQEGVTRAAARLDATGVFNALEAGRRRTSEASENFRNEETQRAASYERQRVQDAEAFEQQREQRLSAFAQQQADELEAFNRQRQRQIESNNIRQADEAFDRQLRRQREQQDRQFEDFERRRVFNERLEELRKQLAQQGTTIAAAGNIFTVFANNVRARVQELFNLTNNPSPINRPAGPSTGPYIPTPGGRIIPTFAAGGLALPGMALVGEQGPELVQFTQPARVYNNSDTRGMLGGINIQNFSPVFGDIGSYTPERISDMMIEALEAFIGQAQARILGGR